MTAYNLVPDGNGGWRAQYLPGNTLAGSETGIQVDGNGNYVVTAPHQLAELLKMNGGVVPPARSSLPAPSAPADAAYIAPEAEGQLALQHALRHVAIVKALSDDRPDAGLDRAIAEREGMQDIDGAVRDESEFAPPANAGEQRNREVLARSRALALGYVLAVIPAWSADNVTDLTGLNRATQLTYGLYRDVDTPAVRVAYAGSLPQIEERIRQDEVAASRRASREQAAADYAAERPQVARVLTEAQAHAESPAGRVERLEAERDAERAEHAALRAKVEQLLAERAGV